MNIRKIKRKCMMRGCKNTDVYAISKTREFGGVILCEDCLKEALKEVKKNKKEVSPTNKDLSGEAKNGANDSNNTNDEKEPSEDVKKGAETKKQSTRKK